MEANNRELDNLLADKSFRDWITNQDAGSALYWNNWLEQDPERKKLVEEARVVITAFRFKEIKISVPEKKMLLERIRETNGKRDEAKEKETIIRSISQNYIIPQKRISTLSYLLRYAAILGGAIVFALSIHLITGGFEQGPRVEIVEKINKRGQKSTIFLPDGSVVVLNSSSKLIYPEEFTGKTREVVLEGEAFFEVTKSAKPFIVKSAIMDARVLGTSFNMKAYPDCDESSIALVTGKVLLLPADDELQNLILNPGEKGLLEKEAGALVKTDFDPEQETAWKDGVLLFTDLPLAEALLKMERWYGVEFEVDEMPGNDLKVTGRFKNESLDNVLHSIGYTGKFSHQFRGNKVYLNFKK